MKVGLTIAGSDSSGGAGIQADIKTFQSLGVFATSAITAVTVQNTQKVYDICEIEHKIVYDQIYCLFEDILIDVVKIGMVLNSKLIKIISKLLKEIAVCPIILDPVMVSKSGYLLLSKNAIRFLIEELIPISDIVTPNLYEAEMLTGEKIKNIKDMKKASSKILDMGCNCVVVKGGHLNLGRNLSVDVFYDGKSFEYLKSVRINTSNTHGTGCSFSTAIAANIAKGNDFFYSVGMAKKYITGAIKNSLDIGKGCGPVNHFFDLCSKN